MSRKHHLLIFLFVTIFFIIFSNLYAGDLGTYPVRFAIIGDRTGTATSGIYEGIVKEIERLKPEFTITVGDMIEGPVNDSTELARRWHEYFQIIKPLSAKMYYTPGNNDIDNDFMHTMYSHYIGNPFHSFDHRGIHITVIDNSRWEKTEDLPEEQLEWLKNDLEKSQSAAYRIVFMHKPFWYRTIAMGYIDEMHELFKKYNVNAVFSGHFHQYYTGIFDGIKYTNIGSSGGYYTETPWGLSFHFAFVTVDDKDINITPIKHQAVQEWNVISVDDIVRSEKNKNKAIKFKDHALVAEDFTIPPTTADLTFYNFSDKQSVKDTIRWEIPEGWQISPDNLYLEIPPADSQTLTFNVSSNVVLYPRPGVNLNFPFNDEINQPVSTYLSVARQADCINAVNPPDIDGVVDEDIWQNPETVLFNQDNSFSTDDSVFYYFAYDDNYLYLAARCYESNMDSLKAEVTEHDGEVYGEDCVGWFLEPNKNNKLVYQIYINPQGTVFDQLISPGDDGYYRNDLFWNGEYDIKTSRDDRFWSVEARISMEFLKADNSAGSKWRINLRRKHFRNKNDSHWQIPFSYNPANFGYLYLK